VAYVLGYTGLGVASTRFGAATMLDLLDGLETDRTRLTMVRKRPMPFPPSPSSGSSFESRSPQSSTPMNTKAAATSGSNSSTYSVWASTRSCEAPTERVARRG